MKIVALSGFLWKGGAQIANLEFFELLKLYHPELELKVVVCNNADSELITLINFMKIPTIKVPCNTISKYPLMDLRIAEKVIREADIVWITDVEYPIIPYIKAYARKKQKKLSVVAYLHSYSLICPHWNATYGLTRVCLEKCTLYRIIRCERDISLKLFELGITNNAPSKLFGSIKSILNYFRWKYLIGDLIDHIDGFIAPSKATWEIHVKHVHELKDKPYAIIRNPVIEPLKHIKPDPRDHYDNYVIYASGYNVAKGPHILLEAWSRLSREFKDMKLYMTGCKGSWIETRVRRMNLNNVIFFGRLPSKKYYYLLYKAKAAVMPSIWPETFGRIPVEANRLGVPAVVSSAGGLPDTIVDGITGYVSKAGDADDLAENIARVLEKEFNREKIIRHSYEKIDPQKEVKKLIKFFENVVNLTR
jgi:glycosyltransferase involved in cell wall biosynthesis